MLDKCLVILGAIVVTGVLLILGMWFMVYVQGCFSLGVAVVASHFLHLYLIFVLFQFNQELKNNVKCRDDQVNFIVWGGDLFSCSDSKIIYFSIFHINLFSFWDEKSGL